MAESNVAANILIELEKKCGEINEASLVEIEVLDEDWESTMVEDQSSVNETEYVVADTAEEMTAIIEDYCERTSNRFSRTQQDLAYRTPILEANFLSHKVLWQEITSASAHAYLQYDGIPFMILGSLAYACQYGKDKNMAKKLKMQMEKEVNGDKSKRNNAKTKKCGCPARILIKRIAKFPDFKIPRNTHHLRLDRSKKLKRKLKEDVKGLRIKELFLGILPPVSAHKFHETVCCNKEPVDKDLVILAQELALNNMSVTDITKEIQNHVLNEIFFQKELPAVERRRFNPSRRDVQNFIHRIRDTAQLSKTHSTKLKESFEKLREQDDDNLVYFDIVANDTEEEKTYNEANAKDRKARRLSPLDVTEFVIFFQTSFQRHLLRRYGHIVYIVEIHPKVTVKKAVTFRLFLLMVQTNVNIQIVATIIFNKSNKNALKEVLEMCKQSNNNVWFPQYLLVDVSEDLLDVVNEVFPDVECFFNSRSCLKVWSDFLRRPSNGLLANQEEVLTYLKTMQISSCKDDLTTAASFLEQSDLWQNSTILRNWFEEQWLPLAKKWVNEYRPEELSLLDTDALCGELDKYEELLSNSTRNISQGFIGLVQHLIETVPDDAFKSYTSSNENMYLECLRIERSHPGYRFQYGLPFPLLHRSHPIIEMIKEKEYDMQKISFTEFHVAVDDETFLVSFNQAFPSCTCAAWQQSKLLPCLHMFVVFDKTTKWKYDALSTSYRTTALLEIDYSCVSSTAGSSRTNTVGCQTTTALNKPIAECKDLKGLQGQVKNLIASVKQCGKFIKDQKFVDQFINDLSSLQTKLQVKTNQLPAKNYVISDPFYDQLKRTLIKCSTSPSGPGRPKEVLVKSLTVKHAKKPSDNVITISKKELFNEIPPSPMEAGVKRKNSDPIEFEVTPVKKSVTENEQTTMQDLAKEQETQLDKKPVTGNGQTTIQDLAKEQETQLDKKSVTENGQTNLQDLVKGLQRKIAFVKRPVAENERTSVQNLAKGQEKRVVVVRKPAPKKEQLLGQTVIDVKELTNDSTNEPKQASTLIKQATVQIELKLIQNENPKNENESVTKKLNGPANEKKDLTTQDRISADEVEQSLLSDEKLELED